MIDEQRYRALIQQLATGGITGNNNNYMNGGGVGSMMQPKRGLVNGPGGYAGSIENIINSAYPQGDFLDIRENSPTQKDYNINATKDLVENLPGGILRDILAPAAAATLSVPYDTIQGIGRAVDNSDVDTSPYGGIVDDMETPRGPSLSDLSQAINAENPLSSLVERTIGASAPLAERLSGMNFGMSQAAASEIDVNDLTNRNNGNFLISAADTLPNQTGMIESAPSITNNGVRTMEGSLIDGDDITSRYGVQQDFPSTIDRFSNTVGPVPNVESVYQDKIMGGLEGNSDPYNFNQNFNQNYDTSSDDLVPGMGVKEINFKDAPADGIFTKNNIAKGIIDKNITNRGFNKGTPEATAQFLAANNFPIPENLKQFLEVDTTTGKYVSKKSPNNFMSFMSNVPTPFNLAKKGLGAVFGANSNFSGKMRGIDPATGLANTQSQYEAERARSQTVGRVNNMMARKAAGKSYSQKNLDRLSAEISAGRDPNQGNTVTGFGKSGMGRDPNDVMGGAGPSGGKSIVCTAMYQTTGLQDWAKAMKVWYIYQKRHLSDAHQEGYHLLFKPFVKGMHKSKIIRAIGAHVAKHRTQELKHIMFNSKSDTLGKIYNNILEPICYLAGKIKSIFKK